MTTQHQEDPFAPDRESRPSVKFHTIGQTYTLEVQSAPKLVQSRDYTSGELATWSDGNPKMAAVVDVLDTATREQLSLWAPKPSALFAAIQQAQQQSGQVIAPGGTLTVSYTHDKPNDNPRLNPAKQYSVRYTQPSPGSVGDPFAARSDQAQQAPPPPSWATTGPQAVGAGAPLGPATPTAQAPQGDAATEAAIAALRAAGINPETVLGGQS